MKLEFEMCGLKRILRVPWTVNRVGLQSSLGSLLEKAEVKRSLLENIKTSKRKLSFFGHIG